jgi:hypothetical protein
MAADGQMTSREAIKFCWGHPISNHEKSESILLPHSSWSTHPPIIIAMPFKFFVVFVRQRSIGARG